MKVAELMTEHVVSVSPETSLKAIGDLLVEHRISGVPVVDADRRVLGVVSEADIVRTEAGESRERGVLGRIVSRSQTSETAARTAEEAMTSPALTSRPGDDVAQVARRMTERKVNRLPVIDDAERLVGIVTRADLVRAFVRSDEEIVEELRDRVVLGILWIDPNEVQIAVEEGDVRLAGQVETKADAQLLEHFAARVPGVVSVQSQLRWRIDEPRVPSSDPRVPRPPPR